MISKYKYLNIYAGANNISHAPTNMNKLAKLMYYLEIDFHRKKRYLKTA